MIKVVVADAEALFGEALAIALGDLEGFEICGEQPTAGPAAVEQVITHQPDIAVLDYWLRAMEGPAATVTIRAQAPQTKVILLCWFHGPSEVHHALASGAAGLLPKSLSLNEIAEGVRQTHHGKAPVIDPGLEKMLSEPSRGARGVSSVWGKIEKLTPRELEVLRLLGDGHRAGDIAGILSVTQATVNRHIHHILVKTDTHSQFEAVALARQYGLLQS